VAGGVSLAKRMPYLGRGCSERGEADLTGAVGLSLSATKSPSPLGFLLQHRPAEGRSARLQAEWPRAAITEVERAWDVVVVQNLSLLTLKEDKGSLPTGIITTLSS
jgi:hypothetical protein